MIIKRIVIKLSLLMLPSLLLPSIAQAEYFFVYSAPASCFSCHRVVVHRVRPCVRHVRRVAVRRVHHRCFSGCGTVSVRYVVPVVVVDQFAGFADYYPSSCFNNECYRYNPDYMSGDDLENQY